MLELIDVKQRPNLSIRSVGFDALFSLFEAEGIVAGFQDDAVVGDAVEQDGGHLGVAEHGYMNCQLLMCSHLANE